MRDPKNDVLICSLWPNQVRVIGSGCVTFGISMLVCRPGIFLLGDSSRFHKSELPLFVLEPSQISVLWNFRGFQFFLSCDRLKQQIHLPCSCLDCQGPEKVL